MSLKSTEVENCSQIIRAILISSFRSSSCSQTSFPSIIRPILYLWMMISKMKFNSPELNCSIFFPLYCLIVSKKTDHFLREIVRSESWFWWLNINPSSFVHRYDSWCINRFSLLWFCFCLWSGCNNLDTCLWHLIFLWIKWLLTALKAVELRNQTDLLIHLLLFWWGFTSGTLRMLWTTALWSSWQTLHMVSPSSSCTSSSGPFWEADWVTPLQILHPWSFVTWQFWWHWNFDNTKSFRFKWHHIERLSNLHMICQGAAHFGIGGRCASLLPTTLLKPSWWTIVLFSTTFAQLACSEAHRIDLSEYMSAASVSPCRLPWSLRNVMPLRDVRCLLRSQNWRVFLFRHSSLRGVSAAQWCSHRLQLTLQMRDKLQTNMVLMGNVLFGTELWKCMILLQSKSVQSHSWGQRSFHQENVPHKLQLAPEKSKFSTTIGFAPKIWASLYGQFPNGLLPFQSTHQLRPITYEPSPSSICLHVQPPM